MENAFLYTLAWNLFVAFSIVTVVFLVKFIKEKLVKNLEYITATTVGLLMWIIFLGFIPKLTESWFVWEKLWIFILIWIFAFYLFELFLHWHHCKDLGHQGHSCHAGHSHETSHKNWILMFGGTMLHNSFHWIVLFSAFSINIHFWIATTIAVMLHSIPQNIVNYIMNHNNIKYSYFAALGWILWALITYPFSDFLIKNKMAILAIISGWLLYTALADIFPEFKEKGSMMKKVSYLVFILIWILLFVWFEYISH